MKIIFLLTILVLLAGCATYTQIDGRNWDEFEKNYKGWVINYKLPRGYIVDIPYSNKISEGLGGYSYDVLQGAGVYGSAWSETKISLFVAQEEETDIKALIQSRLKKDLKECTASSEIGWDRISCDNPEKEYITQFYLIQLHSTEYLYIVMRIRDEAYRRNEVRENRLKMFKDILQTIKVTNA